MTSPSPLVRADAVYSAVRNAILDGSYPPGTTITESAVAVRYGVARPTAKLALQGLVTDGLLRRGAHQAARVPELTRDDIGDLFDNRARLEAAATAALARAGAVPPAAVAAQRALREHAADFARADIAFHRALVAGQPSPRLARMHSRLMGEVELCIGQVQAHHLLDATTIAEQHQRILDAI
ncbi:MAG TPA: GntR family transcriptional regulator, partial [Pseudolysinimonas sp.]|nr:GntR family transcriptional regulator [Pseudolysinimonas sp.]